MLRKRMLIEKNVNECIQIDLNFLRIKFGCPQKCRKISLKKIMFIKTKKMRKLFRNMLKYKYCYIILRKLTWRWKGLKRWIFLLDQWFILTNYLPKTTWTEKNVVLFMYKTLGWTSWRILIKWLIIRKI